MLPRLKVRINSVHKKSEIMNFHALLYHTQGDPFLGEEVKLLAGFFAHCWRFIKFWACNIHVSEFDSLRCILTDTKATILF